VVTVVIVITVLPAVREFPESNPTVVDIVLS